MALLTSSAPYPATEIFYPEDPDYPHPDQEVIRKLRRSHHMLTFVTEHWTYFKVDRLIQCRANVDLVKEMIDEIRAQRDACIPKSKEERVKMSMEDINHYITGKNQ